MMETIIIQSGPKVNPPQDAKRFTIDVPAELHRRIKIGCAAKGVKMADAIREILDREF